MKELVNWPSNLINAMPRTGYGNRNSIYLISLEAWRRGLHITYYRDLREGNKVKILFSISNGKNTHHFKQSLGDNLSNEAYKACEQKDLTKEYLSNNGVNVPKGTTFNINKTTFEDILDYSNELGYPIVIKPKAENAGKGVFSNISDSKQLLDSLKYVCNELGYKEIIVEEFVEGDEYRILVVDGEVVGAINRVPANVVGDGRNTIEQLIKQKNKDKKKNPNLSKNIINIDKEVLYQINKHGYELNSIPEKGELIKLRYKSNISAGGDPIDILEDIPQHLIEMSKKAVTAIPGLTLCGIDMIVNSKNEGTIIELNTRPSLSLHLFPIEGKPRDVVSPILDHYFPDTANQYKTKLYYDFNEVISPLKSLVTKEVSVLPVNQYGDRYSFRYFLSLSSDSKGFNRLIKRKALEESIFGSIEDISPGYKELILAHSNQNVIKKFINNINKIFNFKIVKSENYDLPIKIGFEIKNKVSSKTDTYNKQMKSIKNQMKQLEKKLKEYEDLNIRLENDISDYENKIEEQKSKNNKLLQKNKKLIKDLDLVKQERTALNQKLHEILNSKSWKYTKLLRKFNSKFK